MLILPEAAVLGATRLKGLNVTKNFTHHPLILLQVQISVLLLSSLTVTVLRVIRAASSPPTFVRHFAANCVKLCRSQTFSGLLATTRSPVTTPDQYTACVRQCAVCRVSGLTLDTLHTGLATLNSCLTAEPGQVVLGLTAPIVRCYGILGKNARSSWRNRVCLKDNNDLKNKI